MNLNEEDVGRIASSVNENINDRRISELTVAENLLLNDLFEIVQNGANKSISTQGMFDSIRLNILSDYYNLRRGVEVNTGDDLNNYLTPRNIFFSEHCNDKYADQRSRISYRGI